MKVKKYQGRVVFFHLFFHEQIHQKQFESLKQVQGVQFVLKGELKWEKKKKKKKKRKNKKKKKKKKKKKNRKKKKFKIKFISFHFIINI